VRQLLVVDHEPHVARVIQVSFERDGWGVSSASGLKEAHAEQIRNNRFDIIFLDVRQMVDRLGGTYVAKPFSPTKLKIMVNEILEQNKGAS
jgi:DNA-binding response OmpR family regulator